MSPLPCKKVYVDTHFMVSNSESTSNFKVELGRTLQMPQDSVFYISDLVIPHSWYSIEEGFNDKLYIRYARLPDRISHDVILYCSPGNYDGDLFCSTFNNLLNSMYSATPEDWNVVYDESTNTLSLQTSNLYQYKIFSDEELKGPNDFSISYNKYDLQIMNNVLRNLGTTPIYSSGFDYSSGFLEL